MGYKALYRTYRPQKFEEVYGQEVIVKTLKNSIINNRISHAYLFSGPRGIGKTTVARILAKALNCKDLKDGEPCCKCESCIEVSENAHPDVIEIDAASNNGVDEIRDIRDKVKFLPVGSKYKIYIIDEVHMLTTGAFNALLKTLEEPPRHAIFILATTEPHKIPQTILSRCQCYEFKALKNNEIVENLKKVSIKENINIDDECLNAIAEFSEGGMRDALSLLDQVSSYSASNITINMVNDITGNINDEDMMMLANSIIDRNVSDAIKKISDLVECGKDENKILVNILRFYKDILVFKNASNCSQKSIYNKEEFKAIANNLSNETLFYYVDILSDIQSKIKYSNMASTYLEIAIIRMTNASTDALKMAKRLQILEEKYSLLVKQTPSSIKANTNNNSEIDNEKISVLENKINKVISQLAKYDFNKMSDSISRLDNDKFEEEINKKIEKIQEDLLLIKTSYNNVVNNASQNSNLSQSEENQLDLLDKKYAELTNKINKLDKETQGQYQDSNYIDERINELSKKINKEVKTSLDNKLFEIDNLKTKIVDGKYTSNYDYDIVEIKDKIINIENKLYKYISIITENENSFIKKTKSKGQDEVGVLEDGIFSLDKINQNEVQQKVSFGDLQKELEVEPQEELIENNKEVVIEQEKNEESNVGTNEDSNDDIIENDSKIDDLVQTIVTENETIVNKPNSQLLKKNVQTTSIEPEINEEKQDLQEVFKDEINDLEQHVANINDELKRNDDNEQSEYDEYSNYDVKVVERIMNDARSENAKNDKNRLLKLWNVLDKNLDDELVHIAKRLQIGNITAVGNKEFIIIYQNELLCNQVMRMRFKKSALKLIYDLTGDTYNYMALPETIWEDKRNEYRSQYYMGVKYPILTPINNPKLNVLTDENEMVDEKDEAISKVCDMFGKDIVTVD